MFSKKKNNPRNMQEQKYYEQLLQNAYKQFPKAQAYPEIMEHCADREARELVQQEQVLQKNIEPGNLVRCEDCGRPYLPANGYYEENEYSTTAALLS